MSTGSWKQSCSLHQQAADVPPRQVACSPLHHGQKCCFFSSTYEHCVQIKCLGCHSQRVQMQRSWGESIAGGDPPAGGQGTGEACSCSRLLLAPGNSGRAVGVSSAQSARSLFSHPHYMGIRKAKGMEHEERPVQASSK